MKFYVFYSNKCQFCHSLLETIKRANLSNSCTLICFETDPDKIPEFITDVPTIVAQNLLKPLIGKKAEEWISNIKYYNQNTHNINTINVIDPNIESALKQFEFNKSESSSISDHYANMNDGEFDKRMLEFNKIGENVPITKDVTNKTISDDKITNIVQDQKLSELISIRKHQLILKSVQASKLGKNNI